MKRSRHNQFTSFGEVFGKTKSKSMSSFAFLYQLQQAWIDWVGPVMAEQTYVRSFENGVLVVWVLHPTLSMHLPYLQPEIAQKIKDHYGKTLKRIVTEHKSKLPVVKKQEKKVWVETKNLPQDSRSFKDVLASVRSKHRDLILKK